MKLLFWRILFPLTFTVSLIGAVILCLSAATFLTWDDVKMCADICWNLDA